MQETLPDPPSGAVKAVSHDGIQDLVAVEEPLEIRVSGQAIAVTMRTPGHDEELALGFLYGEGLIEGPRRVGLTRDLAKNTIVVEGPLQRGVDARRFYTSSSCGVCGKGALEEIAVHCQPLAIWSHAPLARELLASLPEQLIQPEFARTGGLHATGLFDLAGNLLCVREDVGRHNAMDKVVGWALEHGLLPLHHACLCVSGRLSFELVQKALVAGVPILVGIGAPSSLAVELAAANGMTLGGFARHGNLNIYAGAHRVAANPAPKSPSMSTAPK
ncbi:MAG: formate dehydrogenase accessory sulfurtransferase FdhD [Solirubrobacteraceae bacterium]